MGIIITNPDLEYKRLNVELPFSYALNLRSIGFVNTLSPGGVKFSL